jgi:hypothetical protein
MKQYLLAILLLGSQLIARGEANRLARDLAVGKSPINALFVEDGAFYYPPYGKGVGSYLFRFTFLQNGEINAWKGFPLKRWSVTGDEIIVDEESYIYSDTTHSYFHPQFPGAAFGKHILQGSSNVKWARSRHDVVTQPSSLRAILHYDMSHGGGHDTVLGLIQYGDQSSIPYLIGFLDRHHDCSTNGIPCYVDHCREALEKISGEKHGYCAKDWADGLHLSLEDCRRLIPPIRPNPPLNSDPAASGRVLSPW